MPLSGLRNLICFNDEAELVELDLEFVSIYAAKLDFHAWMMGGRTVVPVAAHRLEAD